MARLSKDQWRALRIDFEVKGMSLNALSTKYGADKGNISRRAKKEEWEKSKVQPIILKKMNAHKALAEANAEITTLSTTGVVDIDREVTERLRLEGLFNTDAEHNQNGATKKLKQMEAGQEAELAHYDIHARITAKNKETLLGKTPQNQVNIQNNVGTDADAVIQQLKARHQ